MELDNCDELTTNSIIQNCSTSLESLSISIDEDGGVFCLDKYNLPKLTHFFFVNYNDLDESVISMSGIQSISKNLQSFFLETPFLLHELKNYNFSNLESLWITIPHTLPTVCPKLSFLAISDVKLAIMDFDEIDDESLEASQKDAFNLEVFHFYIWRGECFSDLIGKCKKVT